MFLPVFPGRHTDTHSMGMIISFVIIKESVKDCKRYNLEYFVNMFNLP